MHHTLRKTTDQPMQYAQRFQLITARALHATITSLLSHLYLLHPPHPSNLYAHLNLPPCIRFHPHSALTFSEPPLYPPPPEHNLAANYRGGRLELRRAQRATVGRVPRDRAIDNDLGSTVLL